MRGAIAALAALLAGCPHAAPVRAAFPDPRATDGAIGGTGGVEVLTAAGDGAWVYLCQAADVSGETRAADPSEDTTRRPAPRQVDAAPALWIDRCSGPGHDRVAGRCQHDRAGSSVDAPCTSASPRPACAGRSSGSRSASRSS